MDVCEDLLGVLELSFKHGRTHWKHGGIVGVFGYGGGVIGRYCDQPEMFPGVAHFHTMRVSTSRPANFIPLNILRQICDLWDCAAVVSPTCTVQPVISSFWVPQHRSLKRFFGN